MLKGSTYADGTGVIYLLKDRADLDDEDSAERIAAKNVSGNVPLNIGCTSATLLEKVKLLERENGEKYEIVDCWETPLSILTEKVVLEHLFFSNLVTVMSRAGKKVGMMWFRGCQEKLREVVETVVEEVEELWKEEMLK